MKKWIVAGLFLLFLGVGAQAQNFCLIRTAPIEGSHRIEVKADCGSNPDQLLFAEGLQNTLKNKLSAVGVIDYMVDRNWELLDMEKSIKKMGTETEPPVYYTEFLFRKYHAILPEEGEQ